MSFDQTGTNPGVESPIPEPKTLSLKCMNNGCKSIQAIEIVAAGTDSAATHSRLYQCVKCKHSWAVPVGGSFNF